MDEGSRRIDYFQASLRPATGARDHLLQSDELFQAGLTRLSLARFQNLYRTYSGEALPWFIQDAAVLQRFDDHIALWRRNHPDSTGATEALARHIYSWVTDASGLGIVPQEGGPERSAEQTLAAHSGDCTEFVKIFLALLSRAGFSPFPVWVSGDLQGNNVHHFSTGIEIDGRTFLLDPVYGTFNAPHRRFTRIDLREFLGWHWNNVALDEAQAGHPAASQAAFQRALQISPDNPHLYLNRGIASARSGNTAQARRDFLRSLRIDPQFHPAQYELGNLAFDSGHYEEATRRYRFAIRGAPSEVDYRRNLILSLLHRRRMDEAREELSFLSLQGSSQPDLMSLLENDEP